MDVELTIGIATGVPVTFLTVGGSNDSDFNQGLLDSSTYLTSLANPPTVVTTSYGSNENLFSASIATSALKDVLRYFIESSIARFATITWPLARAASR